MSDGGPSLDTPIQAPSLDGPLTRSKAKELQGKLLTYIAHLHHPSHILKDEQMEAPRALTVLTLSSSAQEEDPSSLQAPARNPRRPPVASASKPS